MKKKTAALLAALGLLAGLAACGDETATQPSAPAPSQADPVQSIEPVQSGEPAVAPDPAHNGYVFVADTEEGEFTIFISQDMADVLAALGEPESYFEAPSCAYDGMDKIYTYPGFEITARPEGEKDLVNSIFLTDDSVTTPEGLYIGASAEDVQSIYGAGSSEENSSASTMFTLEDVTLSIILEDGKVVSIEYLPA